MLNVVTIVGNLGADPEIKYAPSGTCIANLRLAVNDHRKDGQGNKVENTYWFTATAFGKTAEIVGNYCSKGSKVGIIGKLVQREWQDNNGQKRIVVEIRIDNVELLGEKGGSHIGPQNRQANAQPPKPQSTPQSQKLEYRPPPPPEGYIPPNEEFPF